MFCQNNTFNNIFNNFNTFFTIFDNFGGCKVCPKAPFSDILCHVEATHLKFNKSLLAGCSMVWELPFY